MEEIELRLRDAAQRHKFGVLHVLNLKQTLSPKALSLDASAGYSTYATHRDEAA